MGERVGVSAGVCMNAYMKIAGILRHVCEPVRSCWSWCLIVDLFF